MNKRSSDRFITSQRVDDMYPRFVSGKYKTIFWSFNDLAIAPLTHRSMIVKTNKHGLQVYYVPAPVESLCNVVSTSENNKNVCKSAGTINNLCNNVGKSENDDNATATINGPESLQPSFNLQPSENLCNYKSEHDEKTATSYEGIILMIHLLVS